MGKWALIFVCVAACGGGSKAPATPTAGSGGGGDTLMRRQDAGLVPDATAEDAAQSHTGDAGVDANQAGAEATIAGSSGIAQPSGGNGGANASGGKGEVTGGAGAAGWHGDEAGAGTGGAGGISEPGDHVLWSQSWSVAIHDPSTDGGYQNATMGLFLDAGDLCKFGLSGAPSGSTQTFDTDGTCITATAMQGQASGVAVIFDSNGQHPTVQAGRAPITGWVDAVSGHTVKYIRRTQTYSIQLLGSGSTSYNYADFQGTWEAIGD